MSAKVMVEIPGGQTEVHEADTCAELRENLGVDKQFQPYINGKAVNENTQLKEGQFVQFTKQVEGGGMKGYIVTTGGIDTGHALKGSFKSESEALSFMSRQLKANPNEEYVLFQAQKVAKLKVQDLEVEDIKLND